MSELSSIQERLLDTNARLVELDRAIAENPNSAALLSMTRSIRHRAEELEREFLRTAEDSGIDVCSYRVFTDSDESPRVQAITRVVDSFQTLVTTVYASLNDGSPRGVGGPLPKQAVDETAFGLGYVFLGSVGMALTVRNVRDLFNVSALDNAISEVFRMARSESPTQLAMFSERLGPSAVRALYRWTRSHQIQAVGADIQWRRSEHLRSRLLMQPPEIGQLVAAIEAAGDIETETVPLSIMLVGLDTERNTFHARTDGGDQMTGNVSAEVSLNNPARIPGRYTATFTRAVHRQYSLDEDIVAWTLENLEAV